MDDERQGTRAPSLSRRAFLAAAAASGTLALLSACSASSPRGAAGSSDERASSSKLVCAISRPVCIDPYNVRDTSGAQVVFQLFDSLVTYDFEDQKIVALAASGFEVGTDAMTFTFHIGDATFHNGDPVSSRDFKRAWERIVDPASAAAKANGASEIAYHLTLVEGYHDLLSGTADGLSGLTCPDAQTLVVRLSAPYADFPYVAAHPALGPVPAAAESDAAGFFTAPIGNGAYRMAGTWDPSGESIELARYDAHASAAATIETVSLSVQTDAESAYREFQIGNVDVCDCPIARYEDVKADRGMSSDGCTMAAGERLVVGPELATYALCCNITAEPLSNVDLRRAISMAIDRGALCKSVFKSTRLPADDIIPPHVRGYQRSAWPYSKYDPDAAAALLDKVYPKRKDGSRGLRLKLSYNPDGGHKKVMEAIVSNLSSVGIDCDADTADIEVLLDRYQGYRYQMARMDWTADYPMMDSVLFPLFHSRSIAGTNRSGYTSSAVDAALDEARATVDESARISKLQQADALIGADCPVIPLMYYTHVTIASNRVSSLYIDPQKRAHLLSAELS